MSEHRTTVMQLSSSYRGLRYHWTCCCGSSSRDTYRTPEEAHVRAQAHVKRTSST